MYLCAMKLKRCLIFFYLSCLALTCMSQEKSVSTKQQNYRISFGASAGKGIVLGSSDFGGGIVHENPLSFYNVYLRWQTASHYNETTELLFGRPTLEAGLLCLDFSDVVLHQGKTPYDSNTGLGLVAYIGFRRDLLRWKGLHLGYQFQNGAGYCTKPYNIIDNRDNHLIGTHWNIYFAFGLYASYLLSPHWEIGFDAMGRHLSNGSMFRPNKGANGIGGSLSLTYHLDEPEKQLKQVRADAQKLNVDRRLKVEVIAGIGQKSLNDEWIWNAQNYDGNPDGDLHNKEYAVWSLSVAPMYRYSSRYAAGIGIDAQYSSSSKALVEYESKRYGWEIDSYDKFMLGLSLRHEVFYRQFSVPYSIGFYLHQKGYLNSDERKKPFYETIGIRWNPKRKPDFFIGYQIRAHALIADHMALQIGYRI